MGFWNDALYDDMYAEREEPSRCQKNKVLTPCPGGTRVPSGQGDYFLLPVPFESLKVEGLSTGSKKKVKLWDPPPASGSECLQLGEGVGPIGRRLRALATLSGIVGERARDLLIYFVLSKFRLPRHNRYTSGGPVTAGAFVINLLFPFTTNRFG